MAQTGSCHFLYIYTFPRLFYYITRVKNHHPKPVFLKVWSLDQLQPIWELVRNENSWAHLATCVLTNLQRLRGTVKFEKPCKSVGSQPSFPLVSPGSFKTPAAPTPASEIPMLWSGVQPGLRNFKASDVNMICSLGLRIPALGRELLVTSCLFL